MMIIFAILYSLIIKIKAPLFMKPYLVSDYFLLVTEEGIMKVVNKILLKNYLIPFEKNLIWELANAALKSAAQVERHLTLMITKATFERLGGSLTAVRERIRNLSGVNDAFARKMTSSLELDVDFDGTAADFAQLLEAFAIKILELGAGYVKI